MRPSEVITHLLPQLVGPELLDTQLLVVAGADDVRLAHEAEPTLGGLDEKERIRQVIEHRPERERVGQTGEKIGLEFALIHGRIVTK